MMLTLGIVCVASLVWAGVLFSHRRALTYLAAAGALFEGQWLILTLLDRTVFRSVTSGMVYLFGGLVLLIVAALLWRRWEHPYAVPGSGRRDIVIVPVLLLTLGATWLVASHNGFIGDDWVMHGFYNGDTTTFVSLVQKSLLTDGLVTQNPFAGNGSLEYPTLLHAGVASFLLQSGLSADWLRFLPLLTYLQVLIIVPLFFLLWDTVLPEPSNPAEPWLGIRSRMVVLWLQAGLVLYVMALSWDGYVYPQSHFFLTGLFLLVAALLVRAFPTSTRSDWGLFSATLLLTLVLMIANAVTGTAMLAMVAVWLLMRAFDSKRSPIERGSQIVVLLLLGLLYIVAIPGNGALSVVPHVSYSAAGEMGRLALPIGILLVGMYLAAGRQPYVMGAVSGLMALGWVVFFFSGRNIVVENAGRFLYLAVSVGFPLVLGPTIQAWYWIRRELLFSAHTWVQRVAGWLAVASLVLLLGLPAGAAVASAHDNLMFKDEQVVSSAMRNALWWIEDSTPADSVFITPANEPFAVPLFTGRAQLRSDYWLSPDDMVLGNVQQAFTGDAASQEALLSSHAARFLLLRNTDMAAWPGIAQLYRPVLDVGSIKVYDISQPR